MRPKKRILQLDASEDSASIRKFLIETMTESIVKSVAKREELNKKLTSERIDLVVIAFNANSALDLGRTLRAIKRSSSQTATLVLAPDIKQLAPDVVASQILEKPTSRVFLDTLRVLCSRKRGPRAKPKSKSFAI